LWDVISAAEAVLRLGPSPGVLANLRATVRAVRVRDGGDEKPAHTTTA